MGASTRCRRVTNQCSRNCGETIFTSRATGAGAVESDTKVANVARDTRSSRQSQETKDTKNRVSAVGRSSRGNLCRRIQETDGEQPRTVVVPTTRALRRKENAQHAVCLCICLRRRSTPSVCFQETLSHQILVARRYQCYCNFS